MNHIKLRGPIGASLRLRAHAEDNNDIAPHPVFDSAGTVNDDVLAYCARYQLTMTWLLTGEGPASDFRADSGSSYRNG